MGDIRMSLFERIFDYAKEVVALTKEVQDLAKDVEKMEDEQWPMDRRLARVETIIELGMRRSGHTPALEND